MNKQKRKYDLKDESGRRNAFEFIIENFRMPYTSNKDVVYDQLQKKISSRRQKIIGLYTSISVAASICIFFALSFFLNNSIKEYHTLSGEIMEIYLPDSSPVTLNENSSLSFDTKSWKDKRYLKLDGIGFFEVAKGEKFTVLTHEANVQVLGTSFEVIGTIDELRVSCYTGKVAVNSFLNNDQNILIPGDLSKRIDSQLQRFKFDHSATPEWSHLQFNFKNHSLDHVFKVIGKHYDLEIKHPELKNQYFTGKIKDKELNTVLQIICLSTGLDFHFENKILIIN